MAYDIKEATTWPVNELGELVIQSGIGSNTTTGQLPDNLVPIDPTTGSIVMRFPASVVNRKISTPTFAVLGDSISFNNSSNTAGAKLKNSNGYLTWAEALHPAINFPLANNFGVNGENSTQILARVQSVVAAAPTFCICPIGTNDLTADATATCFTTVTTNLAAIYATLNGAGITMVLCTILPRAIWTGLSAPQIVIARKNMVRINMWIRNFAQVNKNIILCDWYTTFANPASATSDPLPNFTSDLLHPAEIGAYWLGKKLVRVLTPYLPAIETFDFLANGVADLIDNTYNPTGNLLLNPMLTGTTGTPSGVGTSGTVADNWTVARSSGVNGTLVASVDAEVYPEGQSYNRQVLTITHSAGTALEEWQLRQTINPGVGTYVSGDIVQGVVKVLLGNMLNVRYVKLLQHDNDGTSNVQFSAFLSEASTMQFPDGITDAIYLKTAPIAIAPYSGSGSQSTTFRLIVGLNATASANATIKISRPAVRKIA